MVRVSNEDIVCWYEGGKPRFGIVKLITRNLLLLLYLDSDIERWLPKILISTIYKKRIVTPFGVF